jgi:galactokinase
VTATWRAPGRVNLIGEHVDYNDGLVLPFALQFVTTARVSSHDGDEVRVHSADSGRAAFPTTTTPGEVSGWAAYVAGVVWAFTECGITVPGLDISISSDVPIGAGLSSSAALTCAITSAVNEELDAGLERMAIAWLARRAENAYVGVPTGAMDQLASMLCERGHALLLDCRSLESRAIRFDPDTAGLALLLIDTNARHSLVGSAYADRRDDCDQALSRLAFDSWRAVELSHLAQLDDERLRRRAHHVVTEIGRVEHVARLLDDDRPAEIGEVLTASHESLRDDFDVSCEELDVTVAAALNAGASGARMIGGGFGGCVLALCRDDAADGVLAGVEAAYAGHGWDAPTVYRPRPSGGAERVDNVS